MKNNFYIKNSLTIRVTGIVVAIILLKLFAHFMRWEVISLNPLFSGIVAANVFLMGFLITGVLTDYKESEKLPGELASSIESIKDEILLIQSKNNSKDLAHALATMNNFGKDIHNWFHKKIPSTQIMKQIRELNQVFIELEPHTQPNFIARLKQEQNTIRRIVTRIHTIRETNFISSGYRIAEITTFFVSIGLILAKINPFYESLFFVLVITFLLTYMLLLIKDLDNPFGYYEKETAERISLKPLEDMINNS